MAANNYVTGLGGSSLNAYDALLKLKYGEKLGDHLQKAGPFTAILLGRTGDQIAGRKIVQAAVNAYPQGNFVMAEGSPFQTFGTGASLNPEYYARDEYMGIQLTGNVIRAAEAGDVAAFARALSLELENVKKQAGINRERRAILGQADILSVSASAAAPTYTLYGRNNRTSSGKAFWYSGSIYHRLNQYVGPTDNVVGAPIYTIETTANERYISAIGGTEASPTITLNANHVSGSIIDGTCWVQHHNRRASGYSSAADDITLHNSHFGMMSAIVDSSGPYAAFAGLSKSTYPGMGGVWRTNSGVPRAYQEKLLRVVASLIRQNQWQTGEPVTHALCHEAVLREHLAEDDGLRRFTPVLGTKGYEKPQVRLGDYTVPIECSVQMVPSCMALIRQGTWAKLPQSSMAMLPPQSPEGRFVPGYDQRQLIMHESFNVECNSPGANGLMDDIDCDVFDVNV